MTQYLTKLALLVTLAAGVALAQAYPQQQPPSGTQPTAPQTQQNPPAPDQTQPANPDKSQQPSTPDKDTSKVPQSDQPAAASSTDVESNIQQAIKNDPSLAGSNIQVKVTNKEVDLSGTVNSDQDKQNAEQIAKTNAGPRKVKNHLKVSTKSPSK
jgi:BON domain-containing protein